MKYRLNRDLPFAQKGAEVYRTSDAIIVTEGNRRFAIDKLDFMPTSQMLDDELDRLLIYGWITEASPKELWINFYKGQYGIAYPTKEMADRRASSNGLECKKYIESEE